MWSRPICLVNARVAAEGGTRSTIRFSSRILAIDALPARGDAVVDVKGAFVLPGLVNAHDHLELNHFGRLKFRAVYENASDWIDDMRPRLREDPAILEGRAHPLSHRLWIGGLKNLLSGATTVSHHNPFYTELSSRFPVRVVKRYGWAHSLSLEGEPVGARGERAEAVKRAYRRTPRGVPFLVHLAEGVDERARRELSRLDELGCLGDNTVLVHGVGLSVEQWARTRSRGAGLVWCPASNRFLLGQTAPVREFLDHGLTSNSPICLGTDSRLTGSRDLLDEMREAQASAPVTPQELLRMVTTSAARLLRLPEAGRLALGLPADLIVIPPLADDPASALVSARRSQLLLVAVAGRPRVGSPDLEPVFAARRAHPRGAKLDGEPRLLEATLARHVRSLAISEPGLEIEAAG